MSSSSDKGSQHESDLFRKEAREHHIRKLFGKIILINRISFFSWTLFTIIVITSLILFLTFFHYSRRSYVDGVIAPKKGVIKLYPVRIGKLQQINVKLGDTVKKDQILALVYTGLTQEGGVKQFQRDILSLQQKYKLKQRHIKNLAIDIARYRKLAKSGYVSKSELERKYNSWYATKIELNDISIQISELKSKQYFTIKAHVPGVVTAIYKSQGQHVTPEKPVIAIIPSNTMLVAKLFVPTKAIGFVKINDRVFLQYQAFPYQRFGIYEGSVYKVDRSIILPHESAGELEQEEPFYRVYVSLNEEYIISGSKKIPLKPGMHVKGILLEDSRPLWQWILDPAFSLKEAVIG